jgi:predicted nucleic acid-binding protein
MRIALDTNVMVYFEGVNDAQRQLRAQLIVSNIRPGNIVLPLQVLAEFTSRLSRERNWGPEKAIARAEIWLRQFATQETNDAVFHDALYLSREHNLQFFDSIIVAAANIAGASLLLTEDLHEGFTWHGVTIANPFVKDPIPQLRSLLSGLTH